VSAVRMNARWHRHAWRIVDAMRCDTGGVARLSGNTKYREMGVLHEFLRGDTDFQHT
jgi:hypothetical protein